MNKSVALKTIEKKVESVNSWQELCEVFDFIKSLNLKFKNEKSSKNYTCFVVLIFVFLWLLSWFSMHKWSFSTMKYFIFALVGYLLFVNLYGWPFLKKAQNTKRLSDLISLKKVALDNDLAFVKGDRKKLLRNFENVFFIFHRGNYYRELARHLGSKYKNKFIYHYFNFHYVDEHYSTSTDAKGNTTTDVTYCHYNLYVIVVPFSSKNFIKISSYDKVSNFIKWKSASIYFNKKFKVYTDKEQAVALFLQPKVIEQIEELYETFPELDIEISPQGLLALSTPDQQLLNYTRQYGVDELNLFKKEIKKVLDQTKLHKALEFINFLKDYHQHI